MQDCHFLYNIFMYTLKLPSLFDLQVKNCFDKDKDTTALNR